MPDPFKIEAVHTPHLGVDAMTILVGEAIREEMRQAAQAKARAEQRLADRLFGDYALERRERFARMRRKVRA